MKAYERLNVEVVKFEAQDVITASVAAPVCECNGTMAALGYDCIDKNHPGCPLTGVPDEEHNCWAPSRN